MQTFQQGVKGEQESLFSPTAVDTVTGGVWFAQRQDSSLTDGLPILRKNYLQTANTKEANVLNHPNRQKRNVTWRMFPQLEGYLQQESLFWRQRGFIKGGGRVQKKGVSIPEPFIKACFFLV